MLEQNQIKVSIIIPVYNAEKYLSHCLDSLVNQTLKEIEIICINDGSKDNSLNILEEYQKKDLRIKIIDQKNQGVSAARNNGITQAKGEYIGFVDSDDWVDLDFYEKLYFAAKKFDSDISSGGFYREGKNLSSKKIKYDKEEFYTTKVDKITHAILPKYSYIWNKIYKRSSLLALNFLFPIGMYYEDMYWLTKVVGELKGFVTVPNTNYHYRKVKGSIVNQKSFKHQADRLFAEKEMFKYMNDNNIPLLAGYKYAQKEDIKLFGIKFMRIEHYYPNTVTYNLFGFIKIMEIRKNYLPKD